MPKSARISRTFLHIASGAVEPHSKLMLMPSGSTPIANDVRAQFPQHGGRDLVGRAVGAIDDDAQSVEPEIAREGAFGEFDIARLGIVDALGAADLGRRRQAFLAARWPSAASIFCSHSSESFCPSGPNSLMPLS